MSDELKALSRAQEEYLRRQSHENMVALEHKLLSLDSEDRIAAYWALLGIAVDKHTQVQIQEAAAARMEDLVRSALMNKSNQVNVHGGQVNMGQVGDTNVQDSIVTGHVGSSQVLTDCLNATQSSQLDVEAQRLLSELHKVVEASLSKITSDEEKQRLERAYSTLVKESTSKQPNRKWYELSGEGIVETAHALLGVGERTSKLIGDLKAHIHNWV